MIAGKAYIRPLRRSLPSGWYHHRHLQATIQLNEEAEAALPWWANYIDHALHHPYWVPFGTHAAPVHCRVYSDASGGIGFGLAINDTVYPGLWTSEALPESSGYKELLPVLLAILELGPRPQEAN